MSVIPTGLSSEPVYMISAASLNKPLGGAVITGLGTAKGLADGTPSGIPAGARLAQVTQDGGGTGYVRYSRAGTPTASLGTVLPYGAIVFEGGLNSLRFLDTANSGAMLQV